MDVSSLTLGPEIDDLEHRILGLQRRRLRQDDAHALTEALEELESCREELIVAEAQLALDRVEIGRLRAPLDAPHAWSQRVLEIVPLPALVVTKTGTVSHANPATADFLGRRTLGILDKPLAVQVDLAHRFAFRRAWGVIQGPAQVSHEVDLAFRTSDGLAWGRLSLLREPANTQVHALVLPLPGPPTPSREGVVGDPVGTAAQVVATLAALAAEADPARLVSDAVLAVARLPGVACATWSVPGDGAPVVAAASSPVGFALGAAELEAGQGPGFDALLTGSAVASARLAGEPRWPGLGDALARHGFRSACWLPVRDGGAVVGVLGLWSPGSAPVDPAVGGALADALGGALRVSHELTQARLVLEGARRTVLSPGEEPLS